MEAEYVVVQLFLLRLLFILVMRLVCDGFAHKQAREQVYYSRVDTINMLTIHEFQEVT